MKSTPILDNKPSAITTTVAAALALIVSMALIITVGIVLVGTKCTLAAIRRRSRRKIFLSNPFMLPKDRGGFNFRPVHAKTDTGDQESLALGELYQMDKRRDVLAA